MPSLARSPSILRAALVYQFSMHNCCMRLFLDGGPDSRGAGFRRDPAADGRRWGCGRGGKTSWPSTHTPRKRAKSRVMRTYALAKQIFDEEGKARRPAAIRIIFALKSLLVSSADPDSAQRHGDRSRGDCQPTLPLPPLIGNAMGVNSIAGLAGSIMADPARTGQTLAGSSGAALSRTDYQHSSAADILWPARSPSASPRREQDLASTAC